jgi:hypothetical protein
LKHKKQKKGPAGLVVHISKWPFGKIPEVASTTFSSASSVVCVCVCVIVVITSSTRKKKPSGFGSFWHHLIKSAASATTSTTTTYQTLEMQKSMCCTIHTHTVAYAI